MKNLNWDDFRIALALAKKGTLTAAGETLGINHSTVLRHINRLEQGLDTKLFIRHQRGYQLTEAGNILLKSGPQLNGFFSQLIDDIKYSESALSGSLNLTTVSDFALILNPVLKDFQRAYPDLRIQIQATDERIPLHTGEVHASLRMSSNIQETDLIAHKLKKFDVQLWASEEYIAEYGIPENEADYANHKWILPLGRKQNIPYVRSLLEKIPKQQLVYQSNSFRDIHSAVYEGMGIGPVTEPHPSMMEGLVELPIELNRSADAALWFIYHKNMKNNQRIKALLSFLKQHMNDYF